MDTTAWFTVGNECLLVVRASRIQATISSHIRQGCGDRLIVCGISLNACMGRILVWICSNIDVDSMSLFNCLFHYPHV